MKKIAGVAGLVALGTVAHAHDPVHTDGDKYKVKIENARVRVLEYKDLPGEKTHEHSHPAFVLVALSPFKRKITLPDGKAMIREFKAGDVLWSEAQTHIGDNIGDLPTHVLMIEMK
jgi:quercetin dioxygenase-like cupin family protein